MDEPNNSEKVKCSRESCVSYRDGYCSLKNPERDGDNCLHYEDTLNSLRLKIETLRR